MLALLFLEGVESTRETESVGMYWRPKVHKEGFSDQPSRNVKRIRNKLPSLELYNSPDWAGRGGGGQALVRHWHWLPFKYTYLLSVFKDPKWCYSKSTVS